MDHDALEMQVDASPETTGMLQIQPAGFLLELSLDWIILRASENVARLPRRIACHADRGAARPASSRPRRCTTCATSFRGCSGRPGSPAPTASG